MSGIPHLQDNRLRLLFLLIGLVLVTVGKAEAHSSRSASYNATGLEIPSMSHGAMLVLDDYYGAILRLADEAKESDPVFRKLKNYAQIQNYYCLWGLIPGAISDEASPFNECSHAYLSGARMLLLQMRGMPSVQAAASDMISTVDAEMVLRGSAFILCEYSAKPFYTGGFITPHWEKLGTHAPSCLFFISPIPLILLFWLVGRKVHRSRVIYARRADKHSPLDSL